LRLSEGYALNEVEGGVLRMKRGRILNCDLNQAIASMGHYDLMIIADAGFPIPYSVKRVDLALEKDVPGILQVLDLVSSDLVYERVVVAEEQKLYNPRLFKKIQEYCVGCVLETWPAIRIVDELAPKAKAIVRTGAFDPWGNVCLFSGVDAARWFDKEGVIVPDFYAERVKQGPAGVPGASRVSGATGR